MADSSEEEILEGQTLETITLEDLVGHWEHSGGAAIKVVGPRANFEGGDIYTLEEKNNTVHIDGWVALPEKSSKNKIFWSKEGEGTAYWSFEGEIVEEGGTVDDEGIDETNIVKGKRRRTNVDYKVLLKQEEERLRKKAKLEGAPSGSHFEQGFEDDDDDDDVEEEGDEGDDEEEEEEVKPKKPVVVAITLDEIKQIASKLAGAKDLFSDQEVLPMLTKLAKFDMNLDALKETKIGVEINKYRKHNSEDVKTRALFLIKKWKSLLG